MKCFITSLLIGVHFLVSGQYVLNTDIVFVSAGDTMQLPYCGGLNTPQFSQIDINQDGLQDLYLYDGSAYKHLVFVNIGYNTDPVYRYAPEFEKQFPQVEDWAVLHDFNCDDIPDFFAYKSGATILYKGKIESGTIVFELYKEELTYTSSIEIPIYTARTDISGFADVDYDGDMDVIAFAVAGTLMRLYKNKSVELGYGCDSLIFEIAEFCWGLINEAAVCSGAELGISCKGGDAADQNSDRLHVGSTVLLFDQDNDGDKDLILGDVSCDNLVYYENGGSADFAEMIWKDTLFPVYDYPLKLKTFPAAYMQDMNGDDKPDIIVASNDFGTSWNRENIWYYNNVSVADTFLFEYQTDKFLSNELVDAGANSRPVFFDYNADGLQDILIGVANAFAADNEKKYGLWLYENIGTAELPAYTLVTDDYAGLAEYLISNLAPFPADLDTDGDADLLIGMYDGTFIFLENTAGAGSAAVFETPVFNYQAIDAGGFSVPCLFDVNGDGLLDLIAGKSAGVLNYYENTGSAAVPEFTLISENWGGVDVRKPGSFEGYSAPFMYRNDAGFMQLAVGSFHGFIYLFDEIEESLSGEFHERDTMFLNYNPGFYSSVFGYDVKGNDALEFIIGNIRGGLQIFESDPYVNVIAENSNPQIQLFPNPVNAIMRISIQGNTIGNYQIYNLNGELLQSGYIAGEEAVLYTDRFLPGVYILRISNDRLSTTVSFVKM